MKPQGQQLATSKPASRKVSEDITRNFNIQLCGNSSVGKTSIIHRLVYDNYIENAVITLGVNYYKKIFQIQDEKVQVTIHDTSGQERYLDITKQSVRKADAIILVYDKTNMQSFQDLESFWLHQFQDIIDLPSTPLILIGNKSDSLEKSSKYPQVSYDQADQLARQHNMAFFETSALSGYQVQIAFESLVQKLFLLKKQRPPQAISIATNNYDSQCQTKQQNCCR